MKVININSGKIYENYVELFQELSNENMVISEVLDGKQRLNTVLDYVRGKFDIDGYYFKDLNYNDLQRFYNTKMVYRNIKYYDKQKNRCHCGESAPGVL